MHSCWVSAVIDSCQNTRFTNFAEPDDVMSKRKGPYRLHSYCFASTHVKEICADCEGGRVYAGTGVSGTCCALRCCVDSRSSCSLRTAPLETAEDAAAGDHAMIVARREAPAACKNGVSASRRRSADSAVPAPGLEPPPPALRLLNAPRT